MSVLEFKVDDIYKAGEIGRKLEEAAGKGFMSTNWMEQNHALFHALRLERVVTFITIGLIVFVAALNILISLIMMVMEKTRDIAVLVSMGAKRKQIRRIFIYQGVLIGVIRHCDWADRRICDFVGGGTLSPGVSLGRGIFHRLRAVRHACAGWRAGRRSGDWNFVYRDVVSLVVGGESVAGRGVAVRVIALRKIVISSARFWREGSAFHPPKQIYPRPEGLVVMTTGCSAPLPYPGSPEPIVHLRTIRTIWDKPLLRAHTPALLPC